MDNVFTESLSTEHGKSYEEFSSNSCVVVHTDGMMRVGESGPLHSTTTTCQSASGNVHPVPRVHSKALTGELLCAGFCFGDCDVRKSKTHKARSLHAAVQCWQGRLGDNQHHDTCGHKIMSDPDQDGFGETEMVTSKSQLPTGDRVAKRG